MQAQTASRSVVVDWGRLEALRDLQSEGEPDVVVEVIAMFQEDSVARLARARDAFACGGRKSLKREAHSLRGSAGLLGAERLRETAEAVERHAGWSSALGPLVDAMAEAISAVCTELSSGAPEKHVR